MQVNPTSDFEAAFGGSQPSSQPAPQAPEPRGVHLIAAALAKAQAKFVQPEKNKTVTVYPKNGAKPYSFEYADYSAIVEAVRGPLSENGICFTHFLAENEDGDLILKTQLIHCSGQILESPWPMRSSNDPKEVGADMTYGKRYCLSALTGCVADDDVDSDPENTTEFGDRKPAVKPNQTSQTGASGALTASPGPTALPKPKTDPGATGGQPLLHPTEAQLARLFTIADEVGWTKDQLREYMHSRWSLMSTKALSREQYDTLVEVISTRAFGPARAQLISQGIAPALPPSTSEGSS